MKWTRTTWLAQAALAAVLTLAAALPARAGLLPIRRGEPANRPGQPVPDLTALKQRWAKVEKLDFLRGVRPGAARLRARNQAAGPFTPDHPETIRVALLRVDFKRDSLGAKTTGNGRFDLSRDSLQVVDPPPHNRAYSASHMQALSRYFRAASYGALIVTYDVFPKNDTSAYHLRDMSDYGPWTLTQGVVANATRLIKDTFKAADTSIDVIPWSSIDRVMIMHAGADFQTDVHSDSPYDIPTFTLGLVDTNEAVTHDRTTGQTVTWDAASMVPEKASQDGLLGAVNGAIAHEFGLLLGARGHFGLPDLYNVVSGLPVIGTWSIMDSGNLLGTRLESPDGEIFAIGLVPGPLDIWSKLQLFPDVMHGGFVFSPDTTLHLPAAEKSPVYGYVPMNQDEYMLLENRQTDPDKALGDVRLQTDPATGVVIGTARIKIVGTDTTVTQTNEYDILQPGSGVLCFHVDNSVLDFSNGVNADTINFGLNTNIHRHGLGIIQSDGSGSLGDGGSQYFQGGPYDPFYRGNISDSLFEDGRPNSHGNSGGRTGISFRVADPPQNDMEVRVHRRGPIYGWPSYTGDRFHAGAATSADLDGDGRPEYYAAAQGGFLYGHDLNGNPLGDPTTVHPFYNLRRNIQSEVMSVPGWGGDGHDALALLWDDSTRGEGARTKLMALKAGPGILPGFPPLCPSLTTPLLRTGFASHQVVMAGGGDGRVWVFDSQAHATPLGDSTGIPVVGRLCLANFQMPGAVAAGGYVASAFADGTIRFTAFTELDAPGQNRAAGISAITSNTIHLNPPGGRLHRPTLLAGNASYSDGANAGPALIVVDSTGWIAALRPSGAMLPGFPYQLDAMPAGIPTLGSLRSDGTPAILIVTKGDRLTAVSMDGRPVPGFPARLPRGRAAAPGCAPLEYRDHSGRPIILVPTTSGDLAALDSVGRPVGPAPLTVAQAWGTGAFFVSGAKVGSPWVLKIGDIGGWQMDSIAGLHQGDIVSFGPGVDEGRTGFLKTSILSAPLDSLSFTDLEGLRVYPNPVRLSQIGELRLSFALKSSQSVRVRLYDLTGRIVAETRWAGHPAGNVMALSTASLGSGIYQCEVKTDSGVRRVLPVGIVR